VSLFWLPAHVVELKFTSPAQFVARLSAPPPNESDHDSEEQPDPNTISTPFRRTPTFEQELDDDDRVDVVVVDNDGFKCYKHLQTPEDRPKQHAQSSDLPDTMDDHASLNTDIELNDLAGGDRTSLSAKGKRRERWRRFIGWHYVRRFQSLSEKQKSFEDEYWRERWCVDYFAAMQHCLTPHSRFSTKKLTLLG
jgi:hypothetical protein